MLVVDVVLYFYRISHEYDSIFQVLSSSTQLYLVSVEYTFPFSVKAGLVMVGHGML